jgi:hypothetical protein
MTTPQCGHAPEHPGGDVVEVRFVNVNVKFDSTVLDVLVEPEALRQ